MAGSGIRSQGAGLSGSCAEAASRLCKYIFLIKQQDQARKPEYSHSGLHLQDARMEMRAGCPVAAVSGGYREQSLAPQYANFRNPTTVRSTFFRSSLWVCMCVCVYVFSLYALINLITVGCNKNFLLLFDEWRGPTVVTGLTRKSLRATISFPFARFNWALPHNTSSPAAITLEPSIFSIRYITLSELHFWCALTTHNSLVVCFEGGFDPDYSNFSTRFACQFAGGKTSYCSDFLGANPNSLDRREVFFDDFLSILANFPKTVVLSTLSAA